MNALKPARFSFSAVALVAGIYVHFLLFAQFGFIQGIRAAGLSINVIHGVLGAMALAGILVSFLAAAMLNRLDARTVAAVGFVCIAAAGVIAAIAFRAPETTRVTLIGISLLTGAGLACATVSAAVLLRTFTGGHALALNVGFGTGLAYFFCTIPAVFTATPPNKGWISALAALAGLAATLMGRARADAPPAPARYAAFTTRGAVAFATVAFLALVWFDSAAFAAVQNMPALRALHWSNSTALWTIGIVHAMAAVASGLLIDRGVWSLGLAAALALLIGGHFGFGGGDSAGLWAAPVYAAGVSLYSTALAAFAALGSPTIGTPPPWRAAWLYAIAGWTGSAAGVGLAEQFGIVPSWAAPAAALVLSGALLAMRATSPARA